MPSQDLNAAQRICEGSPGGIAFVRQLANRGITFPVVFLGCEKAERGAIETAGCVAFFRKPFSAYL